MTHPLHVKAIAQGVGVYLVGVIISAIASTVRANLTDTPPAWSWLLISTIVLLVPIFAGARSAHIARSRPQTHGSAAGLLGTVVALLFLVLVVRIPIPASAMLGWLIIATLLAWLGAILLPLVKPRLGL